MIDKERRHALFLKQGIVLWEKKIRLAYEKKEKEKRNEELQRRERLREERRIQNGKQKGHTRRKGKIRPDQSGGPQEVGPTL